MRVSIALRRLATLCAVVAIAGLAGCGSNDDPVIPENDETPPAAVDDLRINRTSSSSITLNWTSPGDDGFDGRADRYDLRISRNPITAETFTQAEQPAGAVFPLPGGFTETYAFNQLLSETTYYCALKTFDEAGNLSEISNVVQATTNEPPDITAPDTITSLSVEAVTSTSLTLRWIAPGDDGDQGTAFAYDIRYHDQPLDEDTWPAGNVISPSPIPEPAGTIERWPVAGLTPATTYFFAIEVRDEAGNRSEISPNVEVTTLPAVLGPEQVLAALAAAYEQRDFDLYGSLFDTGVFVFLFAPSGGRGGDPFPPSWDWAEEEIATRGLFGSNAVSEISIDLQTAAPVTPEPGENAPPGSVRVSLTAIDLRVTITPPDLGTSETYVVDRDLADFYLTPHPSEEGSWRIAEWRSRFDTTDPPQGPEPNVSWGELKMLFR